MKLNLAEMKLNLAESEEEVRKYRKDKQWELYLLLGGDPNRVRASKRSCSNPSEKKPKLYKHKIDIRMKDIKTDECHAVSNAIHCCDGVNDHNKENMRKNDAKK